MIEYIAMLGVSIMLALMSVSSYYIAEKEPNSIMGYRTKKSSKSKENWKVANKTFGKYSGMAALIALGFSLFTFSSYSTLFLWIHLGIILVGLLFAVIQTEKRLKGLE